MIPFPEMNSEPVLDSRVIHWMFQMRAVPVGPTQIAKILEKRRIPNPGATYGKVIPWTCGMVSRLTGREVYNGRWTRKIRKFGHERVSGFGGQVSEGRKIFLQSDALKIVDDALFQKVLDLRDARGKVAGRPRRPYVLTGKAVCRTCGRKLAIYTDQNNGSHLYCERLSPEHRCEKMRFSNGALEELALEAVADAIGTEARTAFQDEMLRFAEERYEIEEGERSSLRRRIADLEASQDEDMEAMMKDSPAYWRYRAKVDENELLLEELRKKLDKCGPSVPPEEALRASAPAIEAALEALRRIPKPFRPEDAAGKNLVKVLSEAIDRVEVADARDGRFDVKVWLTGKPWGVAVGGPPRVFQRRIVTSALGRKDRVENSARDAIAAKRFRPAAELLEADEVAEARSRFPKGLSRALEGVAIAVVMRLTPSAAMKLLGASDSLRREVISYWSTREGKALRAFFAATHGVQHDPEQKWVRRSGFPTSREWMKLQGHAFLRYPPADPSSGEKRVADSDWNWLERAGLAFPDGSLWCSRRKSDRRYLDALICVIREDLRWADIPKPMGSLPRAKALRRCLNRRNAFATLVRALLQARGIEITGEAAIPPFGDEDFRKQFYSKNGLPGGPKRKRPGPSQPDGTVGGA